MTRRREDEVTFTDGETRVRGGKLTAPRKPIEPADIVDEPVAIAVPVPAPEWPPRYPGFYVHVHADGCVHYWRPGTDPDLNDAEAIGDGG